MPETALHSNPPALWPVEFDYPPGVSNASSPLPPSSMSSGSSSGTPQGFDATATSMATPSIPPHWRRVAAVNRAETPRDFDESHFQPDDVVLARLCQSLAEDSAVAPPPPGRRILELLCQAVSGLPEAERREFHQDIRRLKRGGIG